MKKMNQYPPAMSRTTTNPALTCPAAVQIPDTSAIVSWSRTCLLLDVRTTRVIQCTPKMTMMEIIKSSHVLQNVIPASLYVVRKEMDSSVVYA